MSSDDDELYLRIQIEFENFLTLYDIEEVIDPIDEAVGNALLENLQTRRKTTFLLGEEFGFDPSELTYVGIKDVSSGSIELIVLISTAVVSYVGN